MKLLYFAMSVSSHELERLTQIGCRHIDYAAQNFGLKCLRALKTSANQRVDMLSFRPVFPYPNCPEKVFPTVTWQSSADSRDVMLGYRNTPLLMRLSRMIALLTASWLRARKERVDGIVVYGIHTPSLIPALVLKCLRKSKVVIIAPDLPEFMSGRSCQYSRLRRLLKAVDVRLNTWLVRAADGFVFLTAGMASYYRVDTTRFIVMEGIADAATGSVGADATVAHMAILYTGTLSGHYGIRSLIEAFSSAAPAGVELWLVGAGEMAEKIKVYAAQDQRIRYWGMQAPHQVAVLQAQAMCLINPRPVSDSYTNYSFPSKTVEYLESGRPVLSTKLPGIPLEYFKYLIPIEADDCRGIANAIRKVCEMSEEERAQRGQAGKDFVLREKGVQAQGRRLQDFLNKILGG